MKCWGEPCDELASHPGGGEYYYWYSYLIGTKFRVFRNGKKIIKLPEIKLLWEYGLAKI